MIIFDVRDRPISIFETDTIIFNFFTGIWPFANIQLSTETDIPKFTY